VEAVVSFKRIVADPEIVNKLDDTTLERLAIQQEHSDSDYIEFAPSFLAVEDPPIEYLVNELLPTGVIALMHGEPRARKSWAELEITIALATGTPAFNLERFCVKEPVPVLYSSQEDAARDVRMRARAILGGRGIQQFPETLAFSVHKGIDLENGIWHEALIRDAKRYGFRFLGLDPIRRYGTNVDKGPAEVRAITAYLRRFVIETGTTVGLVHHDVKPPMSGPDARRRSHKASGGDGFAASECPIAFEAAGDISLAYPEDYKFSIDPKPFSFRLETDDPRNPKIARLVGEDTSTGQAADMVTHEKVIAYLTEHKSASGSAIAKGCRMAKNTTLTALEQLDRIGKVDSVKADKKGKATTWFLKGATK
jgi:AAA domain